MRFDEEKQTRNGPLNEIRCRAIMSGRGLKLECYNRRDEYSSVLLPVEDYLINPPLVLAACAMKWAPRLSISPTDMMAMLVQACIQASAAIPGMEQVDPTQLELLPDLDGDWEFRAPYPGQ